MTGPRTTPRWSACLDGAEAVPPDTDTDTDPDPESEFDTDPDPGSALRCSRAWSGEAGGARRDASPAPQSAARAEPMQHRRDPIEERLALGDFRLADVAPCDGDTEGRPSLLVGSRRRREPREAVSALGSVGLGEIQRHRRERRLNLVAEIAITAPDLADDTPQPSNGEQSDLECFESAGRLLVLVGHTLRPAQPA
jgi:hypothetical protein